MRRHFLRIIVSIIIVCSILVGCSASKEMAEPTSTGSVLDYSKAKSWVYFADGARKDIDLFLIGPTVDMGKAGNYNMSLDDTRNRENLLGALNMEKGIFNQTCRIYSPYYRQMTMTVYDHDLEASERQQYLDIAWQDVKQAFLYYMENENNGRPFMLAGFSQGGQLCLELMKALFGSGTYKDRFVAAYVMGWRLTEAETAEYPQIVPAKGADDTGVVIAFDCEAEGTTETLIVPKGVKTIGINPLNWKTDSTPAGKEANLGSFFPNYDGEGIEYKELCGAYISDERGTVIVTDVTTEDYPEGIASLGAGSFHVYDYQFFYRNLEENVITRSKAWLAEHPEPNQ